MKKTTEQFKKEVKKLTNNEYTVLGEYINNKTPIQIKHNKCNNILHIRPDRFLQGDRCPNCYGNKKKTTEQFKKEVYDKVNDEYTVLGEYINNKTPIQIKHNKCNTIWNITPINFLSSNNRCPKCFGSHKKTIEQFKKEVYNEVNDEYIVLSNEYINNRTPIQMKHCLCGYEYTVSPDMFLNKKRRCPKCAIDIRKNKKTLTHEDFLNKLNKNILKEYEFLNEYSGRKKYLEIKHLKCNNIFKMKADEFLSGNRCPKCRESKGEKKICEILNNYNIKYEQQYKFSDLYYKRQLSYDFRIFNNNENDFILIEYDGYFHKYNKYDNNKLQNQKIRDKLKDNYIINDTSDRNLILYRIEESEFNNLENLLIQIFNENNINY